MDLLNRLSPRLAALVSRENATLALFLTGRVPQLDRGAPYREASSLLGQETFLSLQEENARCGEEEKPLRQFLESAFVRLHERAGIVSLLDEFLNGAAEEQILLPGGRANCWQTFDRLREVQGDQDRQRVGGLLNGRLHRFLEIGGQVLEARLKFCEEQEWSGPRERGQALWGDPGQATGADRDSLFELTDEPYRELLDHFSPRLADLPAAALKPCDLPRLLNHPSYDGVFSQGEIATSPFRYLESMGIDPRADGRILPTPCGPRLPWGEALALPIEIPGKIRLFYGAQSGLQPFESYLEAQGRCLYCSSLDAAAPLPRRWFGDPILRDAYGRLWAHCLLSAPWLKRILRADRVKDVLVYTTFRFLYHLRVHGGASRFEDWLYTGGSPARAYPVWTEILRESCELEGGPLSYLREICADTPAAFSLEAICLAAQVGIYLRERFDEDWFMNPKAGQFLLDLWRQQGSFTTKELWSLTGGGSSRIEPLKTLLAENLR